jgi:NADH dehydrogenase [ubiquinone] 1 alpha subcomplex assembly factor 5
MTLRDQGSAPLIFDRRLRRQRRERAAPALASVDFLIREVGSRLAERVADVRRRFPLALDLGCHTGQLAEALGSSSPVEHLVQSDLALAMARRAPGIRLVADEELLPFAPERFDLVLSCLCLHWVNDLPGTLAQIAHVLRPDGLLLAALLGGTTLPELREALLRAELELDGGASLRVSPFVELRDAGALLRRAGFALPIVDVETIAVTYDHPLKLMRELRLMGEANALLDRPRRPLRRATLLRACELYLELFADAAGRVPATFQILMLSGWKPDPDQPQPLRRGIGQVSLARALGAPPETLEHHIRRRPGEDARGAADAAGPPPIGGRRDAQQRASM